MKIGTSSGIENKWILLSDVSFYTVLQFCYVPSQTKYAKHEGLEIHLLSRHQLREVSLDPSEYYLTSSTQMCLAGIQP